MFLGFGVIVSFDFGYDSCFMVVGVLNLLILFGFCLGWFRVLVLFFIFCVCCKWLVMIGGFFILLLIIILFLIGLVLLY